MNVLSFFGNLASIVGLIVSILVAIQAKGIKTAVEQTKKEANYTLKRQRILKTIKENESALVRARDQDSRTACITAIDQELANVLKYYPSLSKEMEQNIKKLREDLLSNHFSYSKICTPLHDIIAVLDEEVTSDAGQVIY